MEASKKFPENPASNYNHMDIPIAVPCADINERMSASQIFQNLEGKDEFNSILEDLKRSNQSLNKAKRDVSANQKVHMMRALSITACVLVAAAAIIGLIFLGVALPIVGSVLAYVLIINLGFPFGIIGTIVAVIGLSVWADKIFNEKQLIPNAAQNLDLVNRQIETDTARLKAIISEQNSERNAEFQKNILKLVLDTSSN